MSQYIAPITDYLFLLNQVFDFKEKILKLKAYQDFDMEIIDAILNEGAVFTEEELYVLNRSGDEEGCHWEDGKVTTPKGFKKAYQQYMHNGWAGLTADPIYGGQGIPYSVGLFIREMIASANSAFGTYTGLSLGAYSAIFEHGSSMLKSKILPYLVQGIWTGTMCLTEPQCGSDLALIKTKALPLKNNLFSITGTKIFITGGEHDLSENIIHLVLARLPDAPPGIKGISLFAVPKLLESDNNKWDQPNQIICTGIEHKMGLKGSVTATLSFEGAKGWLIGEPHKGMKAMFTMMNSSRVGVAIQSVALAETATQKARNYANERIQGRAADLFTNGSVEIIEHADVRRNLLIGKSFIEGGRALCLWAGIHLDISKKHSNVFVQSESESLLALITPVLKSFCSHKSFQATNAAMQVFGGHGYIRETGIEQYVRDGRLIPLYEGTNGIQALDLVNRKISLNNGETIGKFFTLIEEQIQEIKEQYPDYAEKMKVSLDDLSQATTVLLANDENDPYLKNAVADDYLQMFGLAAMSFVWAKILKACQMENNQMDASFIKSKIKTAHFFFERVLPEQSYFYACFKAGSKPIMAFEKQEV